MSKAIENSSQQGDFIDRVLKIKRCAAVVKGGRRFSFAALVVVGDGKGKVGYGYGKANEVPPSVAKAQKQAMRDMLTIPVVDGTLPHAVWGHYGAARVLLMPASAGTGIIAGQTVRASASSGYPRHSHQSFSSNNPTVLIKATFDALSKLRTREDVARLRGVSV